MDIMIHFLDFDRKNAILHADYNCDFTHLLRSILARGADEAHYRSFMSSGYEAEQYSRHWNWLTGIIEALPAMFNEDGTIQNSQRAILQVAISLSGHIIALEREETAMQFELLRYRLLQSNPWLPSRDSQPI